MPITRTQGYMDSKGVVHSTILLAQAAEMLEVLRVTNGSGDVDNLALIAMAEDLVKNQRDALLAILTTGPTSRPGARKRAGTTSPRRAAKRVLTATEATAAFKKMRATVDAMGGATEAEHNSAMEAAFGNHGQG